MVLTKKTINIVNIVSSLPILNYLNNKIEYN